MPVFLLNSETDGGAVDEIDRRLRPVIPELVRIAALEDLARRSLRESARSLVIAVAPSDPDALTALIDRIGALQKDAFFVVVGHHLSALDYKKLVQAGNAEWVPQISTDEILDLVKTQTAPPPASGGRQPVVASFFPTAGGVGNSTLVLETAVQLAKRKTGKEGGVAVIDLDFQTSHICDYLDIAPKFQVEEIIAAPMRLDDRLLDAFASRHPAGFDVFAAQRERLHARDLGVEDLSTLFERLSHRYAHILVDLPVSANPWTAPLLAASEGIFVTGVNTIPGLRQVADALRALRAGKAIYGDVSVVINRCASGLLGKVARVDHVTRVLGDEKVFYVRHSDQALECVNMGVPMSVSRPSDRAVKDIGALVDHCVALLPGAGKADRAG